MQSQHYAYRSLVVEHSYAKFLKKNGSVCTNFENISKDSFLLRKIIFQFIFHLFLDYSMANMLPSYNTLNIAGEEN
jgi:hypothetical protein